MKTILSEILLQYIYNHYCIATCLETLHALPVISLYWKFKTQVIKCLDGQAV